jgi:MFS family permease
MQHILDNLKDPSWWFSAFFIAILASVLAAYLKDWLSALFSGMSRRYRRWRCGQLRKSARIIRNIERDDAYFVFFAMRQFTMALLWCFTAFAYMLSLQQEQRTLWISIFSRIAMLVFQVWFYFQFITSATEFSRGLKRYKRRKGLYDSSKKA